MASLLKLLLCALAVVAVSGAEDPCLKEDYAEANCIARRPQPICPHAPMPRLE